MWHLTRDMWHVTHDMWHMTRLRGWTFSQNFSSLALTVYDLCYYEDLEEKDDWLTEWMNQWINDKAVYRTAPATPGLLISPLGQGEVCQGSRRSASGVKEKCAGVQGKVCHGSRESASAEYHTFRGSTSPLPPMHFSLTPDTLFLDPQCTSPWPLTHFSLTPDTFLLVLEGLFFRVEKTQKRWRKKIQNYFWKHYIS